MACRIAEGCKVMPRRLVAPFEAAALSLAIVVSMNAWGGQIEGRFFPVVKNATISRVVDDGVISRFYGDFEKARDCTFDRLELYWHDGNGNEVRVPVAFKDGPIIRRKGLQPFGPWEVALPRSELIGNSEIKVFHVCHSLWKTETHFYP